VIADLLELQRIALKVMLILDQRRRVSVERSDINSEIPIAPNVGDLLAAPRALFVIALRCR
jgi:hypothetical protein